MQSHMLHPSPDTGQRCPATTVPVWPELCKALLRLNGHSSATTTFNCRAPRSESLSSGAVLHPVWCKAGLCSPFKGLCA